MDNESHDKIDIEEFPTTHAYAPPAQKSVQEILDSDTNDESLKKYKESLLGSGAAKEIVIDPSNYSNVLLKKLSIMVDDKEMRSTTLPTPDEFVLSIKEGCIYKIQLEFQVQREIITGLKYLHKVSRIGVGVAKENWMLGSYGPREEPYIYVSPPEEAPLGMLSRGKYKVRSLVADDDENRYLEWTWYIEISKDW
ncbi:RHO protein GDP dissociation inhibitor domain-containing protein [Ditylenchus destructor]|uniref:RHO protein GDP dissociation inhibitor domain-containing protein n=1 Tax=Ditylenchus destructor TaxID=166010 RepID=A0AAD4NDW1_9BILA|nr:RHO protein GDP dissociation inhibitor domain-containing protein [Ditylenchus destructor]